MADERVQATFHFANRTGKAVSILKVQPACGCTTAELTAYDYAPNAEGDLIATLEIGSMTGRQQKRIVITTQVEGDPQLHEQEIALIAQNSSVLHFSPANTAVWRDGDAPTAKQVTVTFVPGLTGRLIECVPPTDLFTVTAETAADGQSMVVSLTPKSISVVKAVSAHADINFELAGKRRKLSIWGMILPPSFH